MRGLVRPAKRKRAELVIDASAKGNRAELYVRRLLEDTPSSEPAAPDEREIMANTWGHRKSLVRASSSRLRSSGRQSSPKYKCGRARD